MRQDPYELDQPRRETVLSAIVQRCAQRGWSLIALHVRTNHVHVVVDAEQTPGRVMNDLKSYASRVLNADGFDARDRKRWARHGSTRRLLDQKNIDAALTYVVEKQGEPMALWTTTRTPPAH